MFQYEITKHLNYQRLGIFWGSPARRCWRGARRQGTGRAAVRAPAARGSIPALHAMTISGKGNVGGRGFESHPVHYYYL